MTTATGQPNGGGDYGMHPQVAFIGQGAQSRQQPIHYTLGQPAVGIMQPQPPQQLQQQQQQQHPSQRQAVFAAAGMRGGEPSMRESVEGIPQVHMQQQQQQHQQLMAGGQQMLPPSGMGIPAELQGQQLPAQLMATQQPYQLAPGAQQLQYHAPGGIPVQYYQTVPAGPRYPHLPGHVQNYRFGAAPSFGVDPTWQPEWEEEFEDPTGAVLYGNLEVKHRRRTTPEQLRVLEHWFAINPRPDSALREHLAGELGITKRNVQVWFQNRRAKIKNQEKAREAAAADARKEAEKSGTSVDATGDKETDSITTTTQPSSASVESVSSVSQQSTSPSKPNATGTVEVQSMPGTATPTRQQMVSQQPQLQLSQQSHPGPAPSTPITPSHSRSGAPEGQGQAASEMSQVDKINMARRVSIAGGETVSIEQWGVKRQGRLATISSPTGNSPMGLAAAARRNSQPYPTQVLIGDDAAANLPHSRSALPSPKMSPNGRIPSAPLLVTAMRNNTLRRASMPGGAQLLSSTAFTPPRNTSYVHPIGHPGSGGGGARPSSVGRGLSPITDQDSEIDPALRGSLPMGSFNPSLYATDASAFLSVPNGGASLQYQLNPGGVSAVPFAPNSPLPNPTFSFGAVPSGESNTSLQLSTTNLVQANGLGPEQSDSQQQAMWLAFQRGRLGSIASVNSVNTNATDNATTEGGSDVEGQMSFAPNGFDPDTRRASAPADLLHNIGLLSMTSAPPQGQPRPSPLSANFGNGYPQALQTQQSLVADRVSAAGPANAQASISSSSIAGGPYIPRPDVSPGMSATVSAVGSDGPSPGQSHLHMTSNSLMPPPPIPGHSLYQDSNDVSGYGADSNWQLPPSLPSGPDNGDAPYTFGFVPVSSGSNTADPFGHFDLDDFVIGEGGDKEPFAFLADITNNNDANDAVNVLV